MSDVSVVSKEYSPGKFSYRVDFYIDPIIDNATASIMSMACEEIAMDEFRSYLGLGSYSGAHWIPKGRNISVEFDKCTIEVARRAANRIAKVIRCDNVVERIDRLELV